MIGNKNGHGNKGKIIPFELRRRWSKARKGKPSPRKNFSPSKETREKISRTLKLKGICPPYWLVKHKDTDIELIMEKALQNRKIEYEKQVRLINNATIADFYLPEHKIVIYCDGEYWHNREDTKQRDDRINKLLSENGFIVFRFRGNDIKKIKDNCLDLVLNYKKLLQIQSV